MSVSTLSNGYSPPMMKGVSRGGLATASAILQSISAMELRERSETDSGASGKIVAPRLPLPQATANGSNFMTDIIDNMKDLFTSSPQTQNPRRILHNPKNVEEFVTLIQHLDDTNVSVNERNLQGDAPLHSLVKKKFARKQVKRELLLALLMHSDVDVNRENEYRNTALHLATEAGDLQTIKLLLSFGANINALNSKNRTPLDLILGPYRLFCRQDSTIRDFTVVEVAPTSPTVSPTGYQGLHSPPSNVMKLDVSQHQANRRRRSLTYAETIELADYLREHGAVRGKDITGKHSLHTRKESVQQFMDVIPADKEGADAATPTVAEKKVIGVRNDSWTESIPRIYYELTTAMELKLRDVSVSLCDNSDEGLALAVQMKELRMLREAGSRILFLDGGGMRGLIQIEILSQLEEQTGRKITELFDWIVATSTGGVVALAMIYAKKTLKELRQLYFELGNDVFGTSRLGMGYNTEALERILKNIFKDMSMSDVKYPRVLVPAVNKSTINLKLHFFNNCFDDEFSTEEVWKVARHTSAAPIFFNESDNYVDGGVLANNPSASGLTKIQDFYRKRGERLPISLAVSVGSGKLPEDELGSADAQDFLFFGKHWFTTKLSSRVENLKTLLGNAVVEGEHIAENVRSRCLEQGISYFRLSPQLTEVIASGETDTDRLIDMILLTKRTVTTQAEFSRLVLRFHQCSEANRKMTRRFRFKPTSRLHRSPAIRRKYNYKDRSTTYNTL